MMIICSQPANPATPAQPSAPSAPSVHAKQATATRARTMRTIRTTSLRRFAARLKLAAFVLAMATSFAGCATLSRVADIGSEPALSPIPGHVFDAADSPYDASHTRASQPQNGTEGNHTPSNRPKIEVDDTATVNGRSYVFAKTNGFKEIPAQSNSLWGGNVRSLFDDQRAKRRGDIVTIMVDISDSAKFANTTSGSRLNSEDAGLNNLLGLGTALQNALPDGAVKENLVDINTSSSSAGVAAIDRSETLEIKVACTVVQVLPNGNLVVQGRQEVRVNAELRELVLSGIIRPSDVTPDNTIDSSKIAEARIGYGGRGYLQHLQQPRYGQQLLDALLPF